MTYQQFLKEFPNDKACLRYVMKITHGGTSIRCPKCNDYGKFSMITKRRAYACQWCGHHIYPCVGTIFEGSKTSLHKWFYAIYLFSTTKHGVSAKELQRQLGVTYKTAWRMGHKIRELMAKTEDAGLLEGVVEVDETYVGGRGKPKTALFGAVERGGKVRTQVVSSSKRKPLHTAIKKNIVPTSTVYSDQLLSY